MTKPWCSIKEMGVIAELLSKATNCDALSLHAFMCVCIYAYPSHSTKTPWLHNCQQFVDATHDIYTGIYTSPSLTAILLAISLHSCTQHSALSYSMLWMLTCSPSWLLLFTPCSPGPCPCPLGKAHNVCAVRSRTCWCRVDRISKLTIEIPDSPRAAVFHGDKRHYNSVYHRALGCIYNRQTCASCTQPRHSYLRNWHRVEPAPRWHYNRSSYVHSPRAIASMLKD